MEEKTIIFKGSTEGLAIIIPESYTADQVMTEVGEKIQAAARFFKGAHLNVTYRGILLTPEEETKLFSILDHYSGAIIGSLHVAAAAVVAEPAEGPAGRKPAAGPSLRRFFTKGQDESDCKFVRSTLRGGTRIQYEGSVVVIGDVNPGAEVIATGNVIVLGLLRGMVHAGSGGSREAFIAALKLKPTQLRIADLIARSPNDPDTTGAFPEIASVREGIIEVNPLYERL